MRVIRICNGLKRRLKNIIKSIIKKIVLVLPIQNNKIVFDNFIGKGFSEIPSIIADELLRSGRKYKLVWISKEKPKNLPNGIKWANYYSIKAFYHWATAHIWVDNIRNNNMRPKKRIGQYYIQTWHGMIAIKKVEMAAEQCLSRTYTDSAKYDGSITDLFLVSNGWQKRNVEKNFWYNGEIMMVEHVGMFNEQEKKKAKEDVFLYFGFQSNDKIITFAPTFRNGEYDYFDIDFEKLVEEATKKYGGKWHVIIRLHPNVTEQQKKYNWTENVVNGTNYFSADNIMYASEFVITDYSSILFKSMRGLNKTLIYAPDYEFYKNDERGLNFDLTKLPAPFSNNSNDLIDKIITFDCDKYLAQCNSFNEQFGFFSETKNMQPVTERIYNVVYKRK